MDKRKEDLLESIRFLLAEYESFSLEPDENGNFAINPPQLVGCRISFLEDMTVYKYNVDFEFELDSDASYIDYM